MTPNSIPCDELLDLIEHYYDAATDRALVDAHLGTCASCRLRLELIQERLRALPCKEFVELVTDYLEGALDRDTMDKAEDHLRLCEGCRAYLDQMRHTIRVMGRLPDAGEDAPHRRAALLALFRAWKGG